MPYSNFDDASSLRSVYHESQEEDNDIDVGEFILNKLLVVGELFDRGDDDHALPKNHQPEPMQVLSLQSGFLYCNKIITVLNEKPVPVKPTGLFKENKFSFDFHASVFHPPAALS